MPYFSGNNFVAETLDGYETEQCFLTLPAALALKDVQQRLQVMGLSLKIFDAYRPQSAVEHILRWSKSSDLSTKAAYYPRLDKTDLFTLGYLFPHSTHSRGSTVDLTIIDRQAGNREWDMGTYFDFFDEKSHTASDEVAETAQKNRRFLYDQMAKAGFQNLATEWWHFTLIDESYPDTYFNFAIK